MQVVEIIPEKENDLKNKICGSVFNRSIENLFVFTAYRDLETWLLCTVPQSTKRNLVQDGANFYFEIKKTVFLSRLKETLKIYRNLWKKGILFIKPVLYKKHMAQCPFVDFVWVTNPEIYPEPFFNRKPVVSFSLFSTEKIKQDLGRYFSIDVNRNYNDHVIYISTRLTDRKAVENEIVQLKIVIARSGKQNLLIKLHPGAAAVQTDLFNEAFGDCVIKNSVPAELYITGAKHSYIIGTASAALYYNNPSCRYFSLIKIHQQLEIFPSRIEVRFPIHVKVLESLDRDTDLGMR